MLWRRPRARPRGRGAGRARADRRAPALAAHRARGLYGAGTAFFGPAFDAIVPDLLPASELRQANSLDQFVRPIAFRLVGPALGGLLVALSAPARRFALDAASFAASAAALARDRALGRRERAARDRLVAAAIARGASRFVRRHVWLWGTLRRAAFAYLVFLGPAEVLLPYSSRTSSHGRAGDLGLVLRGRRSRRGRRCALVMGAARPAAARHHVHVRDLDAGDARGGGLRARERGLAADAGLLRFNALETAGTIVWATTKQRHVPAALLGRVSSLDWLISIGLLPLSFALTGPVAAAIGVRATLVGAGPPRRGDHARRAVPARDARDRELGRSRRAHRWQRRPHALAPRLPSRLHCGPRGAIAQLGERLDRTQEVAGSSPASSTPIESGPLRGP